MGQPREVPVSKHLAFLPDEPGDRVHQVELRKDFEVARLHFNEHGGAFVAEKMSDTFDGRIGRYQRQRRAHQAGYFAHRRTDPHSRQLPIAVQLDRTVELVVLGKIRRQNVLAFDIDPVE